MDQKSRCAIADSWPHQRCSIDRESRSSSDATTCEFEGRCAAMMQALQQDSNMSTVITKAILVDGLPKIFDRLEL